MTRTPQKKLQDIFTTFIIGITETSSLVLFTTPVTSEQFHSINKSIKNYKYTQREHLSATNKALNQSFSRLFVRPP